MTYEESTSLLPSSKKGGRKTSGSSGFLVNRILVVVSLVLIVVLSVVFQIEVNDLSTQLKEEISKTAEMSKTIKVHERVIERFNSSVTNTDVVTRLGALESDLVLTKHTLSKSLEKTQTEISRELNQTLEQLSQTVAIAETNISNEVDRVKTDVEQYVMKTEDQFSMENSFMVYQLAGTFTLLSCLISMWHMTAHLRKMNQPDVQRRILSILWMAPIYAITSWFSLVFHSAEGYLAIIKDGYEAYIIYQFLSFCISVIGKGSREVVVDLLARRSDHLAPPFRLFGCFELCCSCCRPEPYENNRAFANAVLLQCQAFALQFVFFRPLTTTAMVVLDKIQYYGLGDGPTDYRSPQFYLVLVQNLSIFTAFAGLLKFYHAVDKDLSWCRPFAKFLCIKGVVFMTFWQGLALSILAETTDVGGKDAEEWAKSAQNFLICLEMLLFSIAHFYCFPTEEWEDGYRVKHSRGKFGDSIALGDFFSDVKLILNRSHGPSKKKKIKPSLGIITEDSQREKEKGNRTDGSDESTEVQSATTVLTEAEHAERALVIALEQSLGAAGDDPDIIEAKQRLLESGVLSADYFQPSVSSEFEEDSISSDGEDSDAEAGSVDASDSASQATDDRSADLRASFGDAEARPANEESSQIPANPNGSPDPEAALRELSFDGDTPAVRTDPGDLPGTPGSSYAKLLRPSFFTTVASLAESEEGDVPVHATPRSLSYGSTASADKST